MKCDGNHGGPPCGDAECWNDAARVAEWYESEIAPDLLRIAERLVNRGAVFFCAIELPPGGFVRTVHTVPHGLEIAMDGFIERFTKNCTLKPGEINGQKNSKP